MRRIPTLAFLLWSLASAAAAAGPEPAQPAQPLPSLFSDADYPPSAVRNHEQGAVGFRLEVAADGRPAGCSVVSSSGSQSLDSTTCRLLMERARFRPARDAQGKATADRFTGRIVWTLAGDFPPRLEAAYKLWMVCVMGEASKLAMGDMAIEEIVRRAFPPCAALEGLVVDEFGAPLSQAERGASMAQLVSEEITKARTVLKAPREIPPPPRPD